jgi:hypothetical protein
MWQMIRYQASKFQRGGGGGLLLYEAVMLVRFHIAFLDLVLQHPFGENGYGSDLLPWTILSYLITVTS